MSRKKTSEIQPSQDELLLAIQVVAGLYSDEKYVGIYADSVEHHRRAISLDELILSRAPNETLKRQAKGWLEEDNASLAENLSRLDETQKSREERRRKLQATDLTPLFPLAFSTFFGELEQRIEAAPDYTLDLRQQELTRIRLFRETYEPKPSFSAKKKK